MSLNTIHVLVLVILMQISIIVLLSPEPLLFLLGLSVVEETRTEHGTRGTCTILIMLLSYF